jgi:hypothetical protein
VELDVSTCYVDRRFLAVHHLPSLHIILTQRNALHTFTPNPTFKCNPLTQLPMH